MFVVAWETATTALNLKHLLNAYEVDVDDNDDDDDDDNDSNKVPRESNCVIKARLPTRHLTVNLNVVCAE